MRKKNMSENAFRKQLIREGYWNWLTENPKPITVNWDIIESNIGYKLSAKSKNSLNKVLYKSLYKTILESDSAYEFGDYTAKAMAEERNDPTITVNWRQAELALGDKIPEKVKIRFLRVMRGASFKLSEIFKVLAIMCSGCGIGGTLIRHLDDMPVVGSAMQTGSVVLGVISLILYGISKVLSNKTATLPDIKPDSNLSKAEIHDVNERLKDMWKTSQVFIREKPTVSGAIGDVIVTILLALAILFSSMLAYKYGFNLY